MIRHLWRSTSPGERLAIAAFALAIITQIIAVLRGGSFLVVALTAGIAAFLAVWLVSSLRGKRGTGL